MKLQHLIQLQSVPNGKVEAYEGITIISFPSNTPGLQNEFRIPNCDLQNLHRAVSAAVIAKSQSKVLES